MNEAQLFEFIRSNIISDLIPSPFAYSRWDCVSPKTRSYFELKCRRTHYDELILEQKKYDSMMTIGQELELSPWYVCSTPKKIYFFDLINLKPEWEEMQLPATTDFERNQKIAKTVTLIHTKEAFSINLF